MLHVYDSNGLAKVDHKLSSFYHYVYVLMGFKISSTKYGPGMKIGLLAIHLCEISYFRATFAHNTLY
jgi:hypothetical protein